MPLVPELAVAMLGCARIGATHSIIFGGFSSQAIVDRIQDAEAKLIITADGGYRRGTVIPLKKNVDEALPRTPTVEAEPLDAEHPLFILYTSGTTGKPKGVVHTTGGYLTGAHLTSKWVFDLRDEDTFWCTADIGWVTGHSYIVYGPLSAGATTMMYEGAPDFPQPDRFWRLIEKYRVNIFYTSPTAIRAFIKQGDQWPKAHDMSSL